MNLRKKLSLITSVATVICLLTSQVLLATPMSSTTPPQAPPQIQQTITLNEFNELKELQKKNPEELKSLGLSDVEINQVPNLVNEYKQKLKERASLSDQELKSLGYTEDQVKMLKAIQDKPITDAQAVALAATLSMDPYIAYYYYDSYANKTFLRATLAWEWSSKPIVQHYDLIAIAWSGGFIQDSSYDAQNSHRIHYITSLGYSESYYAWSTTPGQGCSHTFQFADIAGWWAQSGYATASSFANGRVPNVGIRMVYGHSAVNITPSISMNGGSISISPSSIQKTEFYDVYSL